jgi:hypothetical protein
MKAILQPLSLLVAALLLGQLSTQAQSLNYTAAGATNTPGTYTDLGTAGTVIPTANTDDANSAPQNIGFTFNYNGAAFTQFIFNTNGVIRLGSAPPTVANLFFTNGSPFASVDPLASTSANDVNLIMPFDFDLIPGTGPVEYRMATTGTTGSQVCTIQWKNISDKADAGAAGQYANFSFQLKLYETGVIEFVYGPAVASTATPAVRYPNVGLKGSGRSFGQVALALKTAASDSWSATTFTSNNYTAHAHDIASVALPDAGRTYRFTPGPAFANDVSVEALHTLGAVAAVGGPVVVQAALINRGATTRTSLPVTLTVTGATTFTNLQTVATLAPADTAFISFNTYPVTAASGTNTLTVSVPADDLLSNNLQSYSQTITANTLGYLDPTVAPSTTISISSPTSISGFPTNGKFAARYHSDGPAVVSAITASFVGARAVGIIPIYQVAVFSVDPVTNAPGTELFTSATLNRPNATADVTTPIPNIAVSGDFFVVLKEIASSIGLAAQVENPVWPGAFFLTSAGAITRWFDFTQTNFQVRPALSVTLTATPTATRSTALAAAISLYPNPAHRTFTLSLPAMAGERTAHVTLLNTLGQSVQNFTLELSATGTQHPLDVSSLATGLYTLRVQTGRQLATKQVVLE